MPFDPRSQPSLWMTRAPSRPRPPLHEGRAEVIVVGAGMTGLSCALHLRQRGLSVIVLEAGSVGCGATARNVGFVLEGVAESYARTVAIWGSERARRVRQFTVRNHSLIASLVQEHRLRCGYARRGSIHLAHSPQEEAELIEGATALARDGFVASIVFRDGLPRWARDAGYTLGQVIPGDGELDPVAFAQGLGLAAEEAGVRIAEQTEVLSVEEGGGGVEVRTPQGSLHAEAVVLATNAYSARLLPWLEHRVDPTRGQVLATAPLDRRLFPQPIYASHGFEYWRQLDSGEVVMGGWRNLDEAGEVGFEHRLHPGIQDQMERFLRGLHPSLEAVPIAARWSGIMGFSRDSLPLIGPLPGSERTMLCAGFTGHGFGFAALAGSMLAQLVTEGQAADADLFEPRRLL